MAGSPATTTGRNRDRDRSERRPRRNGATNGGSAGPNGEAPAGEQATGDEAGKANGKRAERELRRQERHARPRAPRAERGAAAAVADSAAANAADGAPAPASSALTETEALVLDLAESPKRGSRTLARARKKQRSAAAAVGADADNPALGALNRHLNMLMHQLATAHRVIGRVAAERDALRQQLADLQGIPVEEIVVTTIGASSGEGSQTRVASRPATPGEGASNGLVAKLRYFSADDISVTRKRRLGLVGIILALIIVLWYLTTIGVFSMPSNLSRDSLNRLPFIGDFMTFFLAGWLFYRVFRVSSRGVRWVFPSEDPRRRRR